MNTINNVVKEKEDTPESVLWDETELEEMQNVSWSDKESKNKSSEDSHATK